MTDKSETRPNPRLSLPLKAFAPQNVSRDRFVRQGETLLTPLQSAVPFGMTAAKAGATRRDRGLAQLVRAAVSKTAGREFESLSPCHFLEGSGFGAFFFAVLAAG